MANCMEHGIDAMASEAGRQASLLHRRATQVFVLMGFLRENP